MAKRQVSAIISILVALAWGAVCAQAPQGFGYQAVVRDAVGRVVSDRQVAVRIALLQGAADGAERYAETHTATTDAAGLFTLTVGTGTPASGTFAAIDWAAGTWFLRSEVDPDGGSNFTLSTTQQLLSVPYALFATQADRSGSDAALRTSLDSLARTVPTVPSNVSVFTNDAGYLTSYTETQVLSISHDTLFLTGGSFVKLPAGFSGNYNDLANRPSIPTVPTNVSAFANDAGYLTGYTETQSLSQAAALGNTVNTQVKAVSDPTDPQDVVNLRTLDAAMALFSRRIDSLAGAFASQQGGTTPSTATVRFIDLGLPSGLLWAECNVGAAAPEDYGNYYAWGETATKTAYSWDTYQHGTLDGMTKYCHIASSGYNGFTDGLTSLLAADDAATATFGNTARTPTKAEWEELIANTTSVWRTRNGVYGRRFIGPNGNSIFIPAAGLRSGNELSNEGMAGLYWSASLYDANPAFAWHFRFSSASDDVRVLFDARGAYGFSVRAVRGGTSSSACTTTYGDTTASATGSFNWHGVYYTAGGDYRDTLVNAAGCDSVVTLHLTLATPPSAGPWVDLGLPSGLLWASCNLGANAPESYGNYYAWAETATKANYSWNTYRYGTYYNKLTKYCNDASYGLEGFTDTLTILRPGDDAATAATADGSIHTPTKAQWEELIGNTTGEWTTWNGVNGYRLTAPNGNSIFLPAGWGYLDIGLTGVGSSGGYWSSSLSTDYPGGACFFDFYSDNALMNCFVDRTMGFPIRAVKDTATRTCNTFSDTSATVVSRFNWHGNGYTVSGHYTRTLTNAAGCDSVIVLHLTIQPRQTAAGWVDLGLPSGLLWAESNLGANAPEENGNYYAWGETTPKTEYTYVNYRFGHGEHWATRYCNDSSYGLYGYTDSLTALLPTDDAATAALGNGFRTPTAEEWQELIDNTTSVADQQNGAYGYRFTATNGNSIFLPYSEGQDDWHHSSAMVGTASLGRYWSSTLSSYDPAHAHTLRFSSSEYSHPSIGDSYRNGGYSVRAVQEASASHSCTTYGDTTAVATNRFRWHGTILPSSGDYTLIRTNTAGCDSIVTLHLTVHSTVPAGWVDLGLPSGMLWAESDLGSNTPEVPGNLYAWGETTPKAEYSWANYRYCNGEYDQLTKYCNDASYGYNGFTDTLTVLQPGDDDATVALGNGAHTPTKAEWDELLANCDGGYTSRNGINGRLFRGPNGNTMFLPGNNGGLYGTYWMGTVRHSECFSAFSVGWYTGIDGSGMGVGGYFRTTGGARSSGARIRAVRALQ